MKIEKVSLKEVSELEPLVKSTLNEIEDGLEVLDNQISIGESGRPDIMAVDGNKALTIIELKSVTAGVNAIAQIIGYYEWFVSNLALFTKPFPNINSDKAIRLIVIAPQFFSDTINLSKYLNLDISLVQYTAVRNIENDEVGILYEDIDISPEEGPGVSFRSIEDIEKYFLTEGLLSEFRRVISELSDRGITISPYKGGKNYWIECKYGDDDIGYFQPRKRYFNCQIYDDENEKYIWPAIQLRTYDEWVKKCKDYFDECVEDED